MEQTEKDKITCDADMWLPDDNVMNPDQMSKILDLVIARNPDAVTGEVFCKYLETIANANLAKATVDSAPISSERVDNHAVSFNSNLAQNAWKNFKKQLKTICPMYGYSPRSPLGMKISSGEDFTIIDCDSASDLQL
tara:strand:- start:1543 stop:1953 length:411 start_codon:yes stop_codon:yes gene_type:complete